MHLALYQPEIPQNTGTLLRLCACLNITAHIIEPCGFAFSNRKMLRAGMDYISYVDIHRYPSWEAFVAETAAHRKVLLDTKGTKSYTNFTYQNDDIVIVGKESSGVPQDVFTSMDESIHIPMQGGFRSLNVATAAAMVMGEAIRQTSLLP